MAFSVKSSITNQILQYHPKVKEVIYPRLERSSAIADRQRQMRNGGGMISFFFAWHSKKMQRSWWQRPNYLRW